ncbi:odorant receptor 31 [Nasonia vitripennis]|nr:odorant receptor 31 [Nasonia vitripennis]
MDDKDGFEYAFGVCRKELIIFGMWPKPNDTMDHKVFAIFRLVLCIALNFIFINLVQTIQLFIMWGDLFAMTDIISKASLPIGLVLFKTLVFIYYREALLPLLAYASSDWKKPKSSLEAANMWSNARTARQLSITCLFIGLSAVNYHMAVRICQELRIIPGKTKVERELYFNAYFPYNYTESPAYELTFAMQYFATVLATFSYSGLYGLFVGLMLHLCGQFANLRVKMDKVAKQADSAKFRQNLTAIIIRHQFLFRFSQIIEKIFNVIFLGEILGCTIQFCLQGFFLCTLSTEDVGLLVMYIFFMVFFIGHIGSHLFICCYVSERLQDESVSIANAAYKCQWYHLPAKDVMLLVMVINRAKDPIQITAGKFCVFSLSLLAQIFKTSGGYLSMLLAVRDKIT